MKIEQEKVVALLVDLGVDTAPQWDIAKLNKKLNEKPGIERYREPNQKLENADSDALYKELRDAIGNAELIEVVGADKPAPAPEAPKPAAKNKDPKPKPAATPKAKAKVAKPRTASAGKLTWKEQLAEWKKNPLTLGNNGAGVFRHVVDELKAAGKGAKPNGLTKPEIVKLLAAKFPDRQASKMETTVSNLVPTRLRDNFAIHVWRIKRQDGSSAYYIPGDGSKPQPKEPKPVKPAAAPKAVKVPAPKAAPAKAKPAAKAKPVAKAKKPVAKSKSKVTK